MMMILQTPMVAKVKSGQGGPGHNTCKHFLLYLQKLLHPAITCSNFAIMSSADHECLLKDGDKVEVDADKGEVNILTK